MWYLLVKCKVLFYTVLITAVSCNPITNASFNSNIRDYSGNEATNITNVKTLQKEELGSQRKFAPERNPIKFKEIPDSALSSSSNGRGLLYHEQPGYVFNDYGENPHYSYGYEYQLHGHHDINPHDIGHHDEGYHEPGHHDAHIPHGYHHFDSGHHHYPDHHHLEHGHHKHFKHELAAKAILWPIAGIALLGAAAALVSNPVLLQLGVISGKRRRRDTEEVSGPDLPPDSFIKYKEVIERQKQNLRDKLLKNVDVKKNVGFKKRMLRNDGKGVSKVYAYNKPATVNYTNTKKGTNSIEDDRFIPVPIKLRTPNSST